MSLRDYFAAKALPEVIRDGMANDKTPIEDATLAYIIADAMLKARKGGK